MKALFSEHAARIPPVRPEESDLYQRHLELLRSWNERMNLVSKNSLANAFATHYVDSIQIADFGRKHGKDLPFYDLGSGAGFPGLIFAIRFPDTRITLFEKSLKKQSFLLAAVAQLGLKNVTVEGAMPDGKVEGIFLGRAVFQRPELFRFFLQHLVTGSRFITNLGGKTEATPAPAGFRLLEEKRYTLPLDSGDRRVEAFELVPRGTK